MICSADTLIAETTIILESIDRAMFCWNSQKTGSYVLVSVESACLDNGDKELI